MNTLIIEYLPSILSLGGLMMISLISPGSDFAVVVRNSLIYSRKTALFTALGIALGILVHVSYTLFGLGIVIRESTWLFLSVKYMGAGYLLYIGYKGLRAKKIAAGPDHVHHVQDISGFSALQSGFLTNALNPKCILFFISLFSVLIKPDTPPAILALYGFMIFIETLIWFSFVAFCFSGKRTREKFHAVGHWIERVTGGILLMLGMRLLFVV